MNRVSVFNEDGDLLKVWGAEGSGDGELSKPSGVALDSGGIVYVVDSLNHRVQKFTKDGEYIAQFGGSGDGDGEFNAPWGISM